MFPPVGGNLQAPNISSLWGFIIVLWRWKNPYLSRVISAFQVFGGGFVESAILSKRGTRPLCRKIWVHIMPLFLVIGVFSTAYISVEQVKIFKKVKNPYISGTISALQLFSRFAHFSLDFTIPNTSRDKKGHKNKVKLKTRNNIDARLIKTHVTPVIKKKEKDANF